MKLKARTSGQGWKCTFQSCSLQVAAALCLGAVFTLPASAGLITPDLSGFTLQNTNADGFVSVAADGLSFVLTGGNNGSGLPGTTTFTGTASNAGTISFSFFYDTFDLPGFDRAGYLLEGNVFELTDTGPLAGIASFDVAVGSVYGFYVATDDNIGEPGVLSVTLEAAPEVPEPSAMLLLSTGVLLMLMKRRRFRDLARVTSAAVLAACLPPAVFGQAQNHYVPSNVTGQFSLVRTVNLSSPSVPTFSSLAARDRSFGLMDPAANSKSAVVSGHEISQLPASFPHPPLMTAPAARLSARATLASSAFDSLAISGLAVAPALAPGFGFQGVSHYDQRMANSGNQFSVEPPNPAIAVAGGYILEGVNNAVRVFDAQTGAPLTQTVSSNELFGVAPAIDRNSGLSGVYPTDMRVFYDGDIGRWFVIQRSQDNDIFGFPLDRSHLYMAVSVTGDPTAAYNVYVMDTTNPTNPGCPCVPDFPQIGADQYGFYISSNEYNTFSLQFIDAQILAISKTALAAGTVSPGTYRFLIPRITGFEFAIQPASAPKGASQFLASGGVEFFVSSQSALATDNHLAVWALSNSASLQTPNASLLLTQTSLTTQVYAYPDIATQRSGPLPYGSSLFPPGALAFLHGGNDSRILSLTYAGGRLYATLAAQISDNAAHSSVGGAYMILSPTFRNGILSSSVVRQGYLSVPDNHILRPAVAVNAQGRGAIAFTLVGPDYYPSAAYVTLDTLSTSSVVQIAAAGTGPEDGFTGYPGGFFPGIARWGDYSTAVVGTDGAIWMVTEYIPSGPRTEFANWGTYVARYVP